MKSVVFFNNKGGVGKTTLLCNLAAYYALNERKRVLVVDADPQCNSTTYMLTDETVDALYRKVRRETIESFMTPLRRGQGYLGVGIKPEKSARFKCDVIPGDPRLALSEDLLAGDWKGAVAGDPRGLQTTLAFKHLATLYDSYDYIFFDVGPSLGAINRAILLAADFFVIPMSVDVFSLMALDNINLSLSNWKSGIDSGIEAYARNEGEEYELDRENVTWKLEFAGYVMQQYKAKVKRGEKVHVKAYERISKQIPTKIEEKITANFSSGERCRDNAFLGEIENLHSLVPMSQTAKSPIFGLKSRDGVVGSHFTKVAESESVFGGIAKRLLENMGDTDD